MHHIEDQAEYRDIVSALYEAYDDAVQIDAKGVATTHVGTYELHNHRTFVLDTAEYEGEASDVLTRALNPYDVLRYTEVRVPMGTPRHCDDTAAQIAIEALARDLNAHND